MPPDGVPAFKFIYGEHSKTRLNVLEAQKCTNFGDFGFVHMPRIVKG
jgi:hypothetical protein